MISNIDDISLAFGRIVRDTSTYYVIGYQPENTTMDGKVRKIEVKADVPGVTVRARKTYMATKPCHRRKLSGASRSSEARSHADGKRRLTLVGRRRKT